MATYTSHPCSVHCLPWPFYTVTFDLLGFPKWSQWSWGLLSIKEYVVLFYCRPKSITKIYAAWLSISTTRRYKHRVIKEPQLFSDMLFKWRLKYIYEQDSWGYGAHMTHNHTSHGKEPFPPIYFSLPAMSNWRKNPCYLMKTFSQGLISRKTGPII